MPLKPVAKDGDVAATEGSVLYSPAVSGAWTKGTVSTTPYPFLKIDGVAVIHEATCTFKFSGLDSVSATVTGESSVTLTATSTTLQNGSTFVLRNGDTAHDTYGNTLTANASNHLRSD